MHNCRVCLKSKPRKDISDLTLQPLENGEKQSYHEIIEFCLGIQVNLNENISTKLCLKCYRKIIEFYNFKALALKNDAHLRSVQNQFVVLLDDKIKKEEYYSDIEASDNDHDDEPIVYVKEECKDEYLSDNELLSVVKNNKYSNLIDDKEDLLLLTTNVKRPKKSKTLLEKKICDICGKAVRDLCQHKTVHQEKTLKTLRKFECELCGKILSSKRTMQRHINFRHLNIREECPECGKLVKVLKVHLKRMHSPKSQKFGCMECSRAFITQNLLNDHMTIHTKERPFNCETCAKAFRTKLGLQTHIRSVHNREQPHMCQFCSKRFYKKYHLQIHIRKHTNERPYECTHCKKMFKSLTILNKHLLIHKNERKYNCTICDSSFISPDYLKSHMVSHIKDKKFPCQYCNVRFHRSDHRKRHEFTAHLKHSLQDGTTPS